MEDVVQTIKKNSPIFRRAAQTVTITLGAVALAACGTEDTTTGTETEGSGGAVAMVAIGVLIVGAVIFAAIKKRRSGDSDTPASGGITSSSSRQGTMHQNTPAQNGSVPRSVPNNSVPQTAAVPPPPQAPQPQQAQPGSDSDSELPPKLFDTAPRSPHYKPGSEDR